jgi:hypothetical protein
MHTFVTLFDKNYLTRGLALYTSLEKNCTEFILYILAMDTETEKWLKNNIQVKADNISVIGLNDIENFYPELKKIKTERNRAEYCWTLTPYSIQYVLKQYKTSACTYLDADIYFFNSPDLIFTETKKLSVIITEHNYTPRYDLTEISGKYCVQFMYFKNNKPGNEVLEWWRKRCEEWCFSKSENGKFGDQKYLDDWTTRFKCVHVSYHAGAGLAPWNIQKYDISKCNTVLYMQDKITQKKEELIFYHYHGLKEYKTFTNKEFWHLTGYDLTEQDKNLLYTPYIDILRNFNKMLPDELKYSPVITSDKPISNLKIIIRLLKNCIKSFFFISRYKELKQELKRQQL